MPKVVLCAVPPLRRARLQQSYVMPDPLPLGVFLSHRHGT